MTARNAKKTSNPHPAPRSARSAPSESPSRTDRAAPRRSRRSRSRAKSAYAGEPAESAPSGSSQLTSVPTHRGAYAETRRWLLEQHGPVCAYCARRGNERDMTLDHVTPRRGQTAYDRRDNLVLACRECNANKADKAILTFLLGRRERAATLLRYGSHLSPMLVDLAKQIAGPEAAARAERLADPDYPYAD